MAKKRKKAKLRAPKATEKELRSDRFNEPCPKCESHSTWCVPCFKSRGLTYGCRSCGHEWMDQAARESAQREEEAADMAKKKKMPKRVKKGAKTAKRKTTEAGLSMCGFIRDYAKKHPKATAEEIAKAVKAALDVVPAKATVYIQSCKGRA